jgi:2-succinyl-6-hydroxy-2,4-cyclohexadiene-1-carboxylate synthase
VIVNGVNINAKKTGSGPPVVALHGFAGNMSTWSSFVQQAKHHYTVITIDLLGHGRSDSPKDYRRYSPKNSIADTMAVLEKFQVAQPSWLGYSMGGRLALLAASSNPESCRSLILEGASPGLLAPNARIQRRKRDAALARHIIREGVGAFSNYWEQQPLFASQRSLPRSIRERIRRQRLGNSAIGLANTLRAANPGAQPPVHNSLSKLKTPVLCIVGEYDHKYRSIARQMCSKLPHGQVAIIPRAGHAPHIERSREFNRVVLKFLNEIIRPEQKEAAHRRV